MYSPFRASPIAQLEKESACNAGDPGLIPGSGKAAGEGKSYPLQYSWASLVAQLVKNPPASRRPQFDFWIRKIHWRRERLPTPVFLGFPCGSAGKESACTAGDLGSIPVLGRCPGGRHSNPLQYSYLENLHGQRSLVGYSPWGHKEYDMTERLSFTHHEVS